MALEAIDGLWAKCSLEDRRILHPLGSFLLEESSRLDEIRRTPSHRVTLPKGFIERHPVASALLHYQDTSGFGGLERLLCIAVAARLAAADETAINQVVRLTENIRGAIKDGLSPLRLLLKGARSLPVMVREVDREITGAGARLHPQFAAAWAGWIRDRIYNWMHDDPEALRSSLRPRQLVPDLEGSQVALGGTTPTDPEDQTTVPITLTEPQLVEKGESLKVVKAKARAQGLVRTSHGDLSVPADQMAPTELVAALAKAATASAKALLARGERYEAEPPIALLLAMATALREMDLPMVVWGSAADGHLAVIDPIVPVMHRAVIRPANAVRPGPALKDWLAPSTETVIWPLPPTLYELLKALAPASGVQQGTPVMPWLTGDLRRRYRLWGVVNEVAPELGLAASQVRLALASDLARQFGPEVVQVLLGDTFSMSAGPAYYSATPGDDVAKAVAAIHQNWFGECSSAPGTVLRFGSRLVLIPTAAQAWSGSLRRQLKSLVHSKTPNVGFDLWEAHRNHLAAALSALTGARPGDWISELTLDEIVPEYGLVLVSDKATDSLRELRVAATGQRWLVDLRDYLDRLVDISSGRLGDAAERLAAAILRSESPLFSVATHAGEVRPLDAAILRNTMPGPLQAVQNHTRHRLNQVLQAKGVTPELRHAQLGWVVSPANTLADLSHWSARMMGGALEKVLDELLVGDGWYPASQRKSLWSWHDVPERPLRDWDEAAREAAQRHETNIRQLREDLRARWEEVAPSVLERLAQAFDEYFPMLRLDVDAKALRFKLDLTKAKAVEISGDQHALLCDRVRQGDARSVDATEAIAARILLYRLIRNAQRKGVVSGPLPSRPVLSITADPSPFFKGLGLAVRQAEAVRGVLLKRSKAQRAHDQGVLAAGVVLAFSATRHIDRAMAAVDAAASAQAPANRPDLIRVPAKLVGRACPMVFSGLPAMTLAKRGVGAPKARAPSAAALGEWCQRALPRHFELPADPDEAAQRIAALMRAAGRLELSGPERLVMLGDAPLAAVPVPRSVARDDDWPPCNAQSSADPDTEADVRYEPLVEEGGRAPHPVKRRDIADDYRRLTEKLNPEVFNRSRQGKSDGKWNWRAALAKALEKLHSEVGESTNVGLLVGYARHRHRYGGRAKRELAHVTLGNDVTRFGSDLLAVAGDDSILAWGADEFNANYLATLLCKTPGARRQAFDALITFHGYLQQVHQSPEIAEADLRALAGQRGVHIDPGMVTPREVKQVHSALVADLEAERALEDATPEAVRLLGLREIFYLVLEGSGIRPNSAHGLTLSDVFLFGQARDFVRVRVTGEFGQAKSHASQGYFVLEGVLWEENRERVVEWLAREKGLLKDRHWWKLPLFGVAPAERRRFSQAYLTRRIDQLLKWSTGQRKAHTYWLRKNRVTARHEKVLEAFNTAKPLNAPTAHAVYGALRASGHASIIVPMTHYLSDPRIIYGLDLHLGRSAPRSAILQITGLQGSHLDMGWQRAGGPDSPERLRVVLNRLALSTPFKPAENRTDPPPLKRGRAITPRHLADYAEAMARESDRYGAVLRSGLSDGQVRHLERVARDLVQIKGVTPWAFQGLRHRSAVLALPRPLKGTDKLYALLDKAPPDELVRLAEAWAIQGYIERLHDHRVILELGTPELEQSARWLLHTTAVHLELDRSAGKEVLAAPIGVKPSRSHAAGTQWILSLAWIFKRMSA